MRKAAEGGQEIPAELDPERRKRAMPPLLEVNQNVNEDQDVNSQQLIVIAGDQEIHHVAAKDTSAEVAGTYIVEGEAVEVLCVGGSTES